MNAAATDQRQFATSSRESTRVIGTVLHAQDSRHLPITPTAQHTMSAGNPDGAALLEKREIEKGLRELGLSARQARRMVAGGYRCYAENIDAEKADELLGELLNFYRTISRYEI